ncbi:MAG: hypothetical protein JWQ52_1548, partial [Phenylobacterium sp.]|nr:hypothetical protein [Phenylobacterium sp.]
MSDSPGVLARPDFARPDFAGPQEALTLAMAEPPSSKGARRRFDPLTTAAVGFFVLAVGFTGWVAMNASPVMVATLMLLGG